MSHQLSDYDRDKCNEVEHQALRRERRRLLDSGVQPDELEPLHDPGDSTTTADEAASRYDPAKDGYKLAQDPRCLWGWGPPTRGCTHRFGHACFRALGHAGECWDAGDPPRPKADRLPCETARRPKYWDSKGRTEANR